MLPVPDRTVELVVRVVAVEILTTTFTTVVAVEPVRWVAPPGAMLAGAAINDVLVLTGATTVTAAAPEEAVKPAFAAKEALTVLDPMARLLPETESVAVAV